MDNDVKERAPHLKEEGQQETIGGLLGSLQKFSDWVGKGGVRRKVTVLFGVMTLGMVAAIAMAASNPRAAVDFVTSLTGDDVETAIIQERRQAEGKRIDRLMCSAIERLRVRQVAARSVTRTFAYREGRLEQIIGVEDVCETNDARGRRLGVEDLPLPIEAIEQTVEYMVKDPYHLKCTARNRDDYADPALREWMIEAELESSVACPVADLSGHPLGLVAVSLRRPIEEAPNLERDVRDVAQRISGYWFQSLRVQEAIERIEQRQ